MARLTLDELLPPGQSPYFGMYRAALFGYTLDECAAHCSAWGVPLRKKDVQNWERGRVNYEARNACCSFDPMPSVGSYIKQPEKDLRLEDFPLFPRSWSPCLKRFFPCSETNQPLMPWGWKHGESPGLMSCEDAKAASPVGWIGQNMMYQCFIVLDVDGVGHGQRDEQVIQFGELFKDRTLCYEDSAKPGSFHLYFSTRHIIPIKHFLWAKLDLMGNEKNAAVYFKNKVSNGKPMLELSPQIWNAMWAYQKERKK